MCSTDLDKYLDALDSLVYVASLAMERHPKRVTKVIRRVIKSGKVMEAMKEVEELNDD